MELSDRLHVPPLHSRTPLQPLLAATPSLLLLTLFLLPPSRLYTAALLSPLLFAALYIPLAQTTSDPAADFGLASANFQFCLVAVDRFLLTPNHEVTFVKAGEKGPPKGWRRIWWAAENTMLMRGVGQRWEVKNLPRRGTELRRGPYVLQRAMRTLVIFLTMDVLSAYMQRVPYFKQRVAFADLSIAEQLINSLCAGAASLMGIAMVYNALCTVTVGLGVWSPSESPDLFGSTKLLVERPSLRTVWGAFWHQCFRRVFTTFTTALLSLLRLPRHSTLGALLSLLTPFTLSGLQHAFAMYAMHRTGLQTFLFFAVQPVGILAELMLGKVARRVGVDTSAVGARFVSGLWVVGWLLWCGPWFFDDLVQAGMWNVVPPFSVAEGLLSGNWTPPK